MSWAKIQVQYGQGATEMINMAHANGFKIQLSALGSPGMVTTPTSTPSTARGWRDGRFRR
jgi:hypothetical protein